MEYKHYDNITVDILNTIKIGDLIKVNDWKKPMRVVGVSDNFFCMIMKVAGNVCYSVCEKRTWNGLFYISTDNSLFGYSDFDYKFDNNKKIKEYLQAFENGKIELSKRREIAITDLFCKYSR